MKHSKFVLTALATGLLMGSAHVMANDQEQIRDQNYFEDYQSILDEDHSTKDQTRKHDQNYDQVSKNIGAKIKKAQHQYQKQHNASGTQDGEQAKNQHQYRTEYQKQLENDRAFQGDEGAVNRSGSDIFQESTKMSRPDNWGSSRGSFSSGEFSGSSSGGNRSGGGRRR